MKVYLHMWGERACFTRPDMKVERESYPVITPSSARAIFEAILYKPEFRWQIDAVAVRNPIRHQSCHRNELKTYMVLKGGKAKPICIEDEHTPRSTRFLVDVNYVVEASIHLTPIQTHTARRWDDPEENHGPNTPAKYYEMFHRRVERGQYWHRPYFGCRECIVDFELATKADMVVANNPNPDMDLGLMVYDMFNLDVMPDHKRGKLQSRPLRTLFHAELTNGIVTIPPWSTIKQQLRANS